MTDKMYFNSTDVCQVILHKYKTNY